MRSRQKGQGLIEFMLILPALLIMLVAIIEGAKLFSSQMRVDNETREIARLAARGAAPEDIIAYSGGLLLEGSLLRLSYVTVNLEDNGEFSSCLDEYSPFGPLLTSDIDSAPFAADQKSMLNTFISIDWSGAFTNTADIESYDIEINRDGQRILWLANTIETAAVYLVEYDGQETDTIFVVARANYLSYQSPWVQIGRYEVAFNMELVSRPYRVIIVEVEQPYISLTGLLEFIVPDMLYSKAEMRVLPMRDLKE